MDHSSTVTVHYTSQGHIKQEVLKTNAVYESQTGLVVAHEITRILVEFFQQQNRYCMLIIVSHVCNVTLSMILIDDIYIIFICAKLFLQLPMGLQVYDHKEEKTQEKHVSL